MSDIQWLAEYKDGSLLSQRTDETVIAFEDIDRSQLVSFALQRDGETIVNVMFEDDGHKLIWTRRVFQTLGQEPQTAHILAKEGEFVMAVMPDGASIVRSDFIEGHWLFDTVKAAHHG